MNHISISPEKTCGNCGEKFSVGRVDKKFCTDACRIDYNNKIKQQKKIALPEFAKTIPRIILNNYRILRKLNTQGTTKVSKDKLISLNFNFHYISSIHTTKKEDTYRFCFDQGYLCLKDNQVLLVTQPDQVQKYAAEQDV